MLNKLAIVTAYTKNRQDIANLTIPRFKNIADNTGAELFVYTDGFDITREPSWSKILFLKEIINKGFDAWWIDDDIIICRNITEDIIKNWFIDRTDKNFILSEDFSQYGIDYQNKKYGINIQCGSFFLRNNKWSKSFLDKVWNVFDKNDDKFWEQSAIARTLSHEKDSCIAIDKNGPYNIFIDNWKPGDYTAHFASKANRAHAIKTFLCTKNAITTTLTNDNVTQELNKFVKEELPKYKYDESKYSGRGFVTCGSGFKHDVCLYVLINRLRDIGCNLPIEIWYNGAKEYNGILFDKLKQINDVEIIDAHKLLYEKGLDSWLYRHNSLNGWELKTYCLIHSKFKDILFLDADNFPMINPEYLFDSKEYLENGAIFWKDRGRLARDRFVWKIMDIPYRDEPEQESGQVLIDKSKLWDVLVLSQWMQNHSYYMYNHIHGDKDMLHVSCRKLNIEYAMPEKMVHGRDTMMQHDFNDNPLFAHNCCQKWTREPPLGEHECIGMEYKKEYYQMIEQSITHKYNYVRFLRDTRPICIDDNGHIVVGAMSKETAYVKKDNIVSLIDEDGNSTADVSPIVDGDDILIGRWNNAEKCTVMLVPPWEHPDIIANESWSGPDEWRIDERHARMLYESVLLLPKNSKILEIGSHKGASTLYLEAATRKINGELHVCDINITPEVRKLFGNKSHVKLHQSPACEFLNKFNDFDFIFIDSDHSEPEGYNQIHTILNWKRLPRIICCHDLNASNRVDCYGSVWQGMILQYHPSYYCLVDTIYRNNERTDRGLIMAFLNIEDYQKAKKTVWRHAL